MKQGLGIRDKGLVKALALMLVLVAGVGAAQTNVPHDWPDTAMSDGAAHVWRFCDASGNLTDYAAVAKASITAAPLTTHGTPTYGQPGYDSTSVSNCSVRFGAGSGAAVSSSSVGNYEWSSAWTVEFDISPMQMASYTGGKVYPLIYKSDYAAYANDWNCNGQSCHGWAIYAYNYSGAISFILSESGQGQDGTYGVRLFASVPTIASTGNVPNNANIHVVFTNPGTGVPTQYGLSVNGMAYTLASCAYCSTSNSLAGKGGFGGVYSVNVTAGGTGYSSSFAVTYTGGGTNCYVPSSTATASSGVITSIAKPSGSYGCTSAPTAVLTAGGGTGGTATTTLTTASMLNTGYFGIGDFSSATYYSTSTMNFAGAAIYPTALSLARQQGHFATLDWYRSMMPAKPSTPTPVVVTNDFCADMDGPMQLWVLERLQQMGYINLLSATSAETSTYGPQWVQTSLARAGMGNVPVGQYTPASDGDAGYCGPAIAAATKAPSLARTSYTGSAGTLRQVFANAAANSVVIFDGGPATTVASFLASGADGISSLTGVQLAAAKLKGYYWQGGVSGASGSMGFNAGVDTTSTATIFTDWPSVLQPFYMTSQNPVGNAPGACNVYPVGSVEYATWYNWTAGACAAGTDTRNTWDVYTVLWWLFPSYWTNSASGTVTYTAGTNTYTWSSGSAGGVFYPTAGSGVGSTTTNAFQLQSFLDSILWSDPALHSTK